MASIIKVDQIQLSDGSMPTAGDLGISGSVVQKVQQGSNTQLQTTADAWVSTGLSATITPSSTSNKILIDFSGSIYNLISDKHTAISVFNGSTNLGHVNWGFSDTYGTIISSGAFSYLYSPNTTSPVTLTIYIKSSNGFFCVNNSYSELKLIEISA